jgi:hypothetical protein
VGRNSDLRQAYMNPFIKHIYSKSSDTLLLLMLQSLFYYVYFFFLSWQNGLEIWFDFKPRFWNALSTSISIFYQDALFLHRSTTNFLEDLPIGSFLKFQVTPLLFFPIQLFFLQ